MSSASDQEKGMLQTCSQKEASVALAKQFEYPNVMMIPRLVKIVINMGVAKFGKDRSALQDSENELKMLTGQKPMVVRSKKSVASFKMREGQPVSVVVTLRKKKMRDFLYRFIHICCPRIRDFRGFKKSADGRGNCTLGVQDQQIFVEVDLDAVRRTQGMHITFVTSAKTDEECFALLSNFGLPFRVCD